MHVEHIVVAVVDLQGRYWDLTRVSCVCTVLKWLLVLIELFLRYLHLLLLVLILEMGTRRRRCSIDLLLRVVVMVHVEIRLLSCLLRGAVLLYLGR